MAHVARTRRATAANAETPANARVNPANSNKTPPVSEIRINPAVSGRLKPLSLKRDKPGKIIRVNNQVIDLAGQRIVKRLPLMAVNSPTAQLRKTVKHSLVTAAIKRTAPARRINPKLRKEIEERATRRSAAAPGVEIAT